MSISTARTTARRVLLTAVIPGLAGAAALAAPAQAEATPTTCATNACIQQLTTHAGGLDLSATFETTVWTNDRLYVYDTSARLVATGIDTRWRKTHVISAPSTLSPNTSYTYRLEAHDKHGNTANRTGAFTTLHRQVDVLFQTVTVSNDSDGGGAGEFKTWVEAGSTTVVPALGQRDISDGQTVPLVSLVRTRDAGPTLPVETELMDNDCTIPEFPFPSCPFPSTPGWTNGVTPFWDWSTAVTTLNTATATNGVHTFSMSVNAAVGFTVNGWYSVTFVA